MSELPTVPDDSRGSVRFDDGNVNDNARNLILDGNFHLYIESSSVGYSILEYQQPRNYRALALFTITYAWQKLKIVNFTGII